MSDWEQVCLDIKQDFREFLLDSLATFARIMIVYLVLVALHVEFNIAVTTAVLLAGSKLVDPSTNWFHRTRGHIRKSPT